jgi:DNA-binding NarL/FixJ family response regulator
VVDASETIRRRLRELLSERCALELMEAWEGSQALEIASTSPIDVVLLDIAIGSPSAGHHEGMVLLAEFRRLAPAALLVVLTNHSSGAYRQACMLYGAHHFFDKSLEFENAVEVTRRLAFAREGRDAARSP